MQPSTHPMGGRLRVRSSTPGAAPLPGRTRRGGPNAGPMRSAPSVRSRWDDHDGKDDLLMASYTVDLFTTLDGFGTGIGPYWGKDGPELREQRAHIYGEEDQTLVFGANTYRLFQRFAPAETDPSHAPLNAARKIVISRTLEEPLTWANSTLIREDALDA